MAEVEVRKRCLSVPGSDGGALPGGVAWLAVSDRVAFLQIQMQP